MFITISFSFFTTKLPFFQTRYWPTLSCRVFLRCNLIPNEQWFITDSVFRKNILILLYTNTDVYAISLHQLIWHRQSLDHEDIVIVFSIYSISIALCSSSRQEMDYYDLKSISKSFYLENFSIIFGWSPFDSFGILDFCHATPFHRSFFLFFVISFF